jgi:hypothetical protein
VPPQVCQFHALRVTSTSAFEAENAVKTALRKRLQPKGRAVRTQRKKRLPTAALDEARQLAVLDDDATGVLTALTSDRRHPFTYATVQASLDKKGGPEASRARRSSHACRPSWPSKLPGRINGRRSHNCTAGCSRSSTSWTPAQRTQERR